MAISCCMIDTHSVPEQHNGTAAIFLYYSISSFPAFSFCVFVILTVLFLFFGASILHFGNLMRVADLVLWFPDRTSVCTHPWQQNDLLSVHTDVKPYKKVLKYMGKFPSNMFIVWSVSLSLSGLWLPANGFYDMTCCEFSQIEFKWFEVF